MDILQIPRERLQAHLDLRRAAAAQHERRHHYFGYFRLALGAMVAYSAWRAFALPNDIPWVLLLNLALFFGASYLHAKVIRRFEMAQRSVQHFERGLRRLIGDFSQAVSTGDSYADPHHPFSGDLDLFGPGGLFPRICHARTREGEHTLARWLLEMDGPPASSQRLQAAAELAPRLELREALALLGPDLKAALHPKILREWAVDRAHLPRSTRSWLFLSNGFSIIAIAASLYTGLSSPLGLAALLSAAVLWRHKNRVSETIHGASHAATDLRVLQGALQLIEGNNFESPMLQTAQQRLRSDGALASERIGGLARLGEWIDSLDNILFKVLDIFFLFSIHFSLATDRWRAENGSLVDVWLRSTGEFEALCSLAAWHFENPDAVAPEWSPAHSPLFEGSGLRHPLLPRNAAVSNDAKLGEYHRLLVVSGSNMSGKSTFLRTIGINALLAHAGAHVPAASLVLSPLQLGASIRTVDSLQEGASRFYAELQRLKAVVDLSKKEPKLLFLLDELLSGTNSHDRKIGAEGIVATLIGNGAIGLVTTHDLALAAIADTVQNQARNVHFEDQIVDGRIEFDYRMKPGIVKTSNALALMRAVGLEITEA